MVLPILLVVVCVNYTYQDNKTFIQEMVYFAILKLNHDLPRSNPCGTVADRLERSARNAQYALSERVRPSSGESLCRDLEQVLRAQLLCSTTAVAPSRHVHF